MRWRRTNLWRGALTAGKARRAACRRRATAALASPPGCVFQPYMLLRIRGRVWSSLGGAECLQTTSHRDQDDTAPASSLIWQSEHVRSGAVWFRLPAVHMLLDYPSCFDPARSALSRIVLLPASAGREGRGARQGAAGEAAGEAQARRGQGPVAQQEEVCPLPLDDHVTLVADQLLSKQHAPQVGVPRSTGLPLLPLLRLLPHRQLLLLYLI